MCGLVHSTFLMTPVIFTGLVSSNSAAKEWCAASGASAVTARHAASARRVLMGASLSTAYSKGFYVATEAHEDSGGKVL